MLTHEDGLLDLGLLNVSFLSHLNYALLVLRGHHLIVLHLLHFFLHLLMIFLFQSHHFTSSLPRFLDLLARFKLLLFQQGDAIG